MALQTWTCPKCGHESQTVTLTAYCSLTFSIDTEQCVATSNYDIEEAGEFCCERCDYRTPFADNFGIDDTGE